MKYLFDCTFIYPQIIYRSIPTYAIRLLKSLPEEIVSECAILVRPNMIGYFRTMNSNFNLIELKLNKYIGAIPIIGIKYFEYVFKKCINKIEYDSILIFDELRVSNLFVTDARKVGVVHDLKSIKDSTNKKRNYDFYKKYFDSCDALIAISKFTKDDIIQYFNLPEDKIKIVYNCVVVSEKSVKPENFNPKHNYILYVNTLKPYKNTLTLVKAFNKIKEEYNVDLVFVGKNTDYWQNTIMGYVRRNGLEGRISRFENVSNEELKYLYTHACLFVTTSLREGFGYTPIEAAICGCPVISSRCEALPDTTKNLLYYYEPATDENALGNKIIEILNNKPSEKELKNISTNLSFLYRPERQASEIIKIMSITD